MANLAKDLSGMQFGSLSVLGRGPNSSDGRARWYVRCGCGKELLVTSSNLLLGRTKSCGCSKKNNKPHISIVGERFGRLVAIERLGTKSKSVIWRCRCDCGNETSVSLSNLRSGHTTSCGCAKREAQQDVSARVSGIRRSEKQESLRATQALRDTFFPRASAYTAFGICGIFFGSIRIFLASHQMKRKFRGPHQACRQLHGKGINTTDGASLIPILKKERRAQSQIRWQSTYPISRESGRTQL